MFNIIGNLLQKIRNVTKSVRIMKEAYPHMERILEDSISRGVDISSTDAYIRALEFMLHDVRCKRDVLVTDNIRNWHLSNPDGDIALLDDEISKWKQINQYEIEDLEGFLEYLKNKKS